MKNLLKTNFFRLVQLSFVSILVLGKSFSQDVGFTANYSVTEGTDNGYTYVNIPITISGTIISGIIKVQVSGYRGVGSYTANAGSTDESSGWGGYVADIAGICEDQNGTGSCVGGTSLLTMSSITASGASTKNRLGGLWWGVLPLPHQNRCSSSLLTSNY